MIINTMTKHELLHKAVSNLHPNRPFGVYGELYSDVDWQDDLPNATQSEIDAEIVRIQAAHDVLAYSRNRKEEYDALNQFELISDDAINSTTTHKDAVEAVKTKWPKDNSGPIE
jgi:hypothetical protein